jgi:hypothetical protein
VRFLACAMLTTLGLLLTAGLAEAGTAGKVIKLVSVQQSQTQTKDGFVIHDNDLINGKKAGRDTLTCKIVSQTKANCRLLIALAGGTIKGTFVIVLSKSSGGGKITGGTGTYASAKGTFTYKNLNAKGTRTLVVLTLA